MATQRNQQRAIRNNDRGEVLQAECFAYVGEENRRRIFQAQQIERQGWATNPCMGTIYVLGMRNGKMLVKAPSPKPMESILPGHCIYVNHKGALKSRRNVSLLKRNSPIPACMLQRCNRKMLRGTRQRFATGYAHKQTSDYAHGTEIIR